MVLKALRTTTCNESDRTEQAELCHNQMNTLTIKQAAILKSLAFFQSFNLLPCRMGNASEAGENCCPAQSLYRFLSDERKQFASLLSRYRGDNTELTPADPGLTMETRQGKQIIHSKNSPTYQRLQRWRWRTGVYWYKDGLRQKKLLLLRPVHSNLQN